MNRYGNAQAMKQVPILFLSDSPDLPTGLGRITRDLATLVARDLPQYRVGTYGRAGNGSKSFPWAQYNFAPTMEDQWGITNLERVWNDFAGNETGVMMTIQDPSRMFWFSQPVHEEAPISRFLNSGRIQKWGYFPIDSTGPGDQLTGICKATVARYDRVLAYTKFGSGVLSRSTGREVDWIPHGIDTSVFQPRDRKAARLAMGFKDTDLVLGVNMTNQPRKDWGLAMTIASFLRDKHHNFKLWAHVDILDRHWSMPALIEDFGLGDRIKVTFVGNLDDEQLSYFYSACDATMLPSLGEGFGYPIAESLACGVPCFHGDYAGGAEMLPEEWRIPVKAWRMDANHYNCVRPVFDPAEWAERISQQFAGDLRITGAWDRWPRSSGPVSRAMVEHLNWKNLWASCWKRWFEAGLA